MANVPDSLVRHRAGLPAAPVASGPMAPALPGRGYLGRGVCGRADCREAWRAELRPVRAVSVVGGGRQRWSGVGVERATREGHAGLGVGQLVDVGTSGRDAGATVAWRVTSADEPTEITASTTAATTPAGSGVGEHFVAVETPHRIGRSPRGNTTRAAGNGMTRVRCLSVGRAFSRSGFAGKSSPAIAAPTPKVSCRRRRPHVPRNSCVSSRPHFVRAGDAERAASRTSRSAGRPAWWTGDGARSVGCSERRRASAESSGDRLHNEDGTRSQFAARGSTK